jgi:hypothetical protein
MHTAIVTNANHTATVALARPRKLDRLVPIVAIVPRRRRR